MRKTLTAVAVSILMVVLPTTANAITNGQLDGNAHPFVGMLTFYDASGTYLHRCTGTLMSETVVLTASHCTDGTSSARVYFDSEVTSDYRNGQGGIEGTPFTHPELQSPHAKQRCGGRGTRGRREHPRSVPDPSGSGFPQQAEASARTPE